MGLDRPEKRELRLGRRRYPGAALQSVSCHPLLMFGVMTLKKLLYVTTLGQYSLRYPDRNGPGIITNQGNASWRLWTFLQYLSVFHDRAVSQEEIFDLLWNDIDSSNPAGAAKTLLHRSRLLLEKLGFPNGKSVLRYSRGLYTWDPELTIRTDAEEFDELCAVFNGEQDSEKSLEAARKAIELYEGDFLPSAAGSPWALSPRTYYHAKFLRLCSDAANVLWENGQIEEAISICRSATAVDPYDETCHLLMMRLLQSSGAKQMAAQYYNEVSNLLMVQLGIEPSQELTALYHELSGSGEAGTLEMDVRTVLSGLQDRERGAGAFFCDYGVFRDIYSLLVRSALRLGQVVQLSLLTILDLDGEPLPQNRRTAAMEEMCKAIGACCRSGDVCAQFSASQYLLLLPTASYENGAKVVKRILNTYQRTMLGMTTTVQCSSISALTAEQRERPLSRTQAAWQWKAMEA